MQLRGAASPNLPVPVGGPVHECNFFDRFGNKEQTGIGGRSRVQPIVPPQPRRGREGAAGHAPLGNALGHSPPLPSYPHRQHALLLSPPPAPPAPLQNSTDAMLLMGLMPSGDTFRTSAVLQPPRPMQFYEGHHAHDAHVTPMKRRTVDFIQDDADESFFEDIDRLRQSQATTQLSDSNIYGTPLRVSAAREEALRRRPSWDRGYDDDAVPLPNHRTSPIGRQQLEPLPNAPRHAPLNQDNHPSKQQAHAQRSKRALEPLATQEAHALESQLRQLKRGGPQPHAKDARPAKQKAPPAVHPGRKPPQPSAKSLSPIRYRTDVANVPGAMYSRPIPAIVASVLYGQPQHQQQQHPHRSPTMVAPSLPLQGMRPYQ